MFELPPPDPSIEIHLYSRGYSKGLAQTDGAQFLIRGELAAGPLFVQAQWKNIDANNAGGEGILLAGLRRESARGDAYESRAVAALRLRF